MCNFLCRPNIIITVFSVVLGLIILVEEDSRNE